MIFYLFFGLIWLICPIVCGAVAASKRKSVVGWLILGLLFGPLAVLGVAIAATEQPAAGPAPEVFELMRACPHCAENIKPLAKVCRHCGRDVEPEQPRKLADLSDQEQWLARALAAAARGSRGKHNDKEIAESVLIASGWPVDRAPLVHEVMARLRAGLIIS